MSRRTLVVLTLTLLWLSPARVSAQGVFGLDDLSGEELFERFCAACHGTSARGDGPVARSLNVAVPDLTRIAERRSGTFPAQEVRETIDGRALVRAHGTRSMPVWGYELWMEQGGDITAERDTRTLIGKLVQYLESIQLRADGRLPSR